MKHKLNERIKNFNITILISLFLLLSCGSGQQPQAGKDGEAATGGRSLSEVLMEVGRSAENVFYSFMELVSGTLGLRVTKDTTRDKVGDYFKSLGDKLGKASEELEQVAVKSNTDVDKDGSIVIAIRSAVDSAKITLSTLKGHLDSLKDIGDANLVGHAHNAQGAGTKADETELKKALKALKGIVETAIAEGIAKLTEGDTTLTVDGVDNKEGAKILSTNGNPDAADVSKAAVILAAVSGEEMLDSIVKSTEEQAKKIEAVGAKVDTAPLEFAVGGDAGNLAKAEAKASAVAGGIALRSLVKDGKLATAAAAKNAGGQGEVQAVGVTAVNKLLVAVEDIIKKTVKNVLKKAKEKIDEARAPKSADQQ
ncbi:variable large family protein [Borrelia turicatae]|uniref:variable large family protein n=1 Tax=Borrelia turicatae TaxID=142 RepID=UPI001FF34AF3|nr:variable large family protein [Borrelia turicatae]UPA15700.1 variable large family protein [Borrelia turicatae]UPA15721.1 variable large family protein [Borrelia turicatae]